MATHPRTLSLLALAFAVGCGDSAADRSGPRFTITDIHRPTSSGAPFLVSSRDPQNGNRDFGDEDNQQSYLYEEDGRYVIFDREGPGVLERIWMTDDSVLGAAFRNEPLAQVEGEFEFFLDDEETPRLRVSALDLFRGDHPSFPAPLAADADASSGGFTSYVPIAYEKRLKIRSSFVLRYIQLSGTDRHAALPSFDPNRDAPAFSALADELADPGPLGAPDHEATAEVSVADEEVTLFAQDGRGTVQRLTLTTASGTVAPPLWVRINVDGGATEIDVPWADLFFTPLGPAEVPGRTVKSDGRGTYELLFPMPFRDSLEIRLAPTDPIAAPITVDAEIAWSDAVADDAMVLHAAYRSESAPADAPNFTLFDHQGAGQLVGTGALICCHDDAGCAWDISPRDAHLEGDEYIRVDGETRWAGTGTEDYFGGGFYYRGGPFGLPTHGMPRRMTREQRLPNGAFDCTTQYRLHLTDPIPFERSLRFELEHGPTSNLTVYYQTVVFYYAGPA